MGERGPAKLPSAITRLRGTYRPDRTVPHEPQFPVSESVPPSPWDEPPRAEIDIDAAIAGLDTDERETLKDALRDPELLDALAMREPPLSLDAHARSLWARLAPMLHSRGLLSDADLPVFEALCEAYAQAKAADAHLREHGIFHRTPNGHIQPSPAITISRNSWAAFKTFAVQFGLTPSARTKVNAIPPEQETEEDFMHGTVKPIRSVK